MASSPSPAKKTVSRCEPETDSCTHVLEIAGYSLHKDVMPSEYIESATFAVGGHDWSILFYPNGDGWEEVEGFDDSVSLYLELTSEATAVRALFDFRLVDHTGVSSLVLAEDRVFSSECPTWGSGNLMEKKELQASYLRDDRLVIECDVTVVKRTSVSKSEAVCDIQVPPSVLLDNLGQLLESKKGSDVTFHVQGEVFHAHKIVLAMRSPVFMAELYGPMSDKKVEAITIEDMQPDVFKALLHFIYKDSLPEAEMDDLDPDENEMDNLDDDEGEEMAKHLLVAADRYAMERMKVMCESILAKRLRVESVANTLALADQHHCSQLKDACIGFINSANRIGDVVASPGYTHLKRACPAVIVEILEKSAKSRKI